MTDALEGCRKFSSRTKARGLSRAARAGGSSRFTGRQIPRMRIPNFEVTGQKKWERMEAGGGRWRHVEGKLRPKSNFFSGKKYFFSGTKYFLSGTKYFFAGKKYFFSGTKYFFSGTKYFFSGTKCISSGTECGIKSNIRFFSLQS